MIQIYYFCVFSASTFLRQMFETDYPKLVRMFSDLVARLEKYSCPEQQQLASSGGTREEEEKMKMEHRWEDDREGGGGWWEGGVVGGVM